jgi:hypothetical protein
MREVSTVTPPTPNTCHINPITIEPETQPRYGTTVEDITDNNDPSTVYTVTADTAGTVQPDITTNLDKSIFTRSMHAFKPERVQKILELVTIGDDLTELQRKTVQALVAEFADCFALAVSEVKAVKNREHKLNIKPRTKFSTKIANCPFSPPQKAYFNKVLDELLEAGVVRPIAAEDVECCSPVSIAQKAYAHDGLTHNELIHRLDEQCTAAGRPPCETSHHGTNYRRESVMTHRKHRSIASV